MTTILSWPPMSHLATAPALATYALHDIMELSVPQTATIAAPTNVFAVCPRAEYERRPYESLFSAKYPAHAIDL